MADALSRVVRLTADGRFLNEIELDWPATGLDVGPDGEIVVSDFRWITKLQPNGRVVWKVVPLNTTGEFGYPVIDVAIDLHGRVAAVTNRYLDRYDPDGTLVSRLPLPAAMGVALDAWSNAHVVGWFGGDTLGHVVLSPENQELRSDGLPCDVLDFKTGVDVDSRGQSVILANGCLAFLDADGSLLRSFPADAGAVDVELLPDGSAFLGFRDHVALVGPDGQEKWRLGDRSKPGIFRNASDVYGTENGNLVVADNGNGRLQIFDASGKLQRVVPDFIGSVVAMDGGGTIYRQIGNDLAIQTPGRTDLVELYPDNGVWRFVLDILIDGDTVLVALDDGSAASSGAEMIRISPSNEERFWVGGDFEAVKQMALEPSGNLIVVLDPLDGSPGHLVRVSPGGGQQRIDVPLGLLEGIVTVAGGGFFVTARGAVYQLDEDGSVLRRLPVPDPLAYCTRLAMSGTTLYALDEALDAVYAYSVD